MPPCSCKLSPSFQCVFPFMSFHVFVWPYNAKQMYCKQSQEFHTNSDINLPNCKAVEAVVKLTWFIMIPLYPSCNYHQSHVITNQHVWLWELSCLLLSITSFWYLMSLKSHTDHTAMGSAQPIGPVKHSQQMWRNKWDPGTNMDHSWTNICQQNFSNLHVYTTNNMSINCL